jgi:hypothetical protein
MSELSDGVVFDYEGALELARQLWELADRWEGALARRRGAAGVALSTWTGPAARELWDRVRAEIEAGDEVCRKFRHEADRWALAWSEAVNDGNRLAWARATAGGADLVAPPLAPVPVGPGFEPTSWPVRFHG